MIELGLSVPVVTTGKFRREEDHGDTDPYTGVAGGGDRESRSFHEYESNRALGQCQ